MCNRFTSQTTSIIHLIHTQLFSKKFKEFYYFKNFFPPSPAHRRVDKMLTVDRDCWSQIGKKRGKERWPKVTICC